MSAATTKASPSELEAWLHAFLRDPGFLEAYPYYAAILAKLTPVADPSVARMAVSLHGGRFFLHLNIESFMAEPHFIRGVLLHEVHHVALGHLTHPKFTDVTEPELMDLAVEMSANEYIEEPLPPAVTCRAYAAVGIRPGQSTWDRYELLVAHLQRTGTRPRPAPGESAAGTLDDHKFFPRHKAAPAPGAVTQTAILLDHAVKDSREERARNRPPPLPPPPTTTTARAKAKAKGRRPSGAKSATPREASPDDETHAREDADDDNSRRFLVAGRSPASLVEELFDTTRAPEQLMDWRAALAHFVARARSPVHTWSRPSRRFPQRIFEVPGRTWTPQRGESPRLLVAIDTSLSMSRLELEEVARQLVVLGERAQIIIAECDVAVARVYAFAGRIDQVVGRGGTDLRAVFAPAILGAHDIDGVVYFTDGDGPFSPEAPPVPTLWVLTKPQAFACPWGEKAWLRPPRR